MVPVKVIHSELYLLCVRICFARNSAIKQDSHHQNSLILFQSGKRYLAAVCSGAYKDKKLFQESQIR